MTPTAEWMNGWYNGFGVCAVIATMLWILWCLRHKYIPFRKQTKIKQ